MPVSKKPETRPVPIFFLRPPQFDSYPPRLAPHGGILVRFMPQTVQQRAEKKTRIEAARPDRRRRFRPLRDRKLYGFCFFHSQEPPHGVRSQRNQPKLHEVSFENSDYRNFRARFRPIHNESHFDVVTKVNP